VIDIRPDHLEIVKNIFKGVLPDCEVFVFGSRAEGPAKEHSDLDLLIKGNSAIDKSIIRKLKTAFEESDLPFRVDIVDWATTQENFRKIIQKHMVKIFSQTKL
jgi:predicted nucleotidyltransferase